MTCVFSRVIPDLKTLAKQRLNLTPASGCLKQTNCRDYIVPNILPLIIQYNKNMYYIPQEHQVDNDETGKKNYIKAPCPPVKQDEETSIFSPMKYEINRLKTFENSWTVSFLKPSDLAAVGLFYLGIRDLVQCAFCRGRISDWVKGDDPSKEHVRHFPMCPFLLGCDVGNVPIGDNVLQASKICIGDGISSESETSTTSRTFSAKYPHMNHIDKRLQTFNSWSATVCRPEELAECGFFYSGQADIVTCFCCGGRVGCWEPQDNPWVEHAKHFPLCAYVKFIKGSTFIDSVQAQGCEPSHHNHQSCNGESVNGVAGSSLESEEQSFASDIPKNFLNSSAQSEASTSHSAGSNAKPSTKYLCKICMEERPRVAFLPCGHSLTCPICAAALSVCPMCRTKIDSFIRIYFD